MRTYINARVESCAKLLAGIVLLALIVVPLAPVFAFSGILPVPANTSNSSQVQISLSSSQLNKGQTATVTFTFSSAPYSFGASDITASDGTISNLATTSNPLVYTATFTPNDDSYDIANAVSVNIPLATTTYAGAGSSPYDIAFDGMNM